MTLAMLLTKARGWVKACELTGNLDTQSSNVAQAVIDLLGESAPCGWDVPAVIAGDDDGPWINAEWLQREVSSDDARGMARMLLAAADEADALRSKA